MNEEALQEKLNELISLPAETEIVEFKEAKNNFDLNKLGKYFSALSNEANLNNKSSAWLVMGVKNDHTIVGTSYRTNRKDLDSLKGEIANKTLNRITFVEIHEIITNEGRVLLFQVPPAPRGVPLSFDGHYYGRDGEELVPLNLEEIERIRNQNNTEDWSAVVVKEATFEDLDPEAIRVARENYKSKFFDKADEVDGWDDVIFLNKAKITIKNNITGTALILLGKEESEHFLSPAEIKIRWVLKDKDNNDKDYEIFNCPLLLAIDKFTSKSVILNIVI